MKKKPITEVVEEKIQEEVTIEAAPVVEEPTKNYVGIAQVRVNIREAADANANIVGVLDKEDTIKVLDKKVTKGFYPVDGGFVKKEYLDVKEV